MMSASRRAHVASLKPRSYTSPIWGNIGLTFRHVLVYAVSRVQCWPQVQRHDYVPFLIQTIFQVGLTTV